MYVFQPSTTCVRPMLICRLDANANAAAALAAVIVVSLAVV